MWHWFRYMYDEEAETEYITEMMRRKLMDKEPAAKYNRSFRKASKGHDPKVMSRGQQTGP